VAEKLTKAQREWCEAALAEEPKRLVPALVICLGCGRRHIQPAGGVCRTCDDPRLIDLSASAALQETTHDR
jgi:hypothetical protein